MKKKNLFKELKKTIVKNAPVVCISFAAFILLVVALMFVFRAKEELVQYSIKNENIYTFASNVRLDFYSTITLDHEENVTKLVSGSDELELGSEPIYYVGRKEAIFPNKMTVVFPLENRTQKKINRYSIIDGQGIQPVVSNVNLKYALTNAFIYDGANIYFFLEPAKITWGTNEVTVPFFSYVFCDYRGDLVIYNYDTEEIIYHELVNDIVTAEFENYKINMSHDAIIVNDKSSLIQKNVESLQLLK